MLHRRAHAKSRILHTTCWSACLIVGVAGAAAQVGCGTDVRDFKGAGGDGGWGASETVGTGSGTGGSSSASGSGTGGGSAATGSGGTQTSSAATTAASTGAGCSMVCNPGETMSVGCGNCQARTDTCQSDGCAFSQGTCTNTCASDQICCGGGTCTFDLGHACNVDAECCDPYWCNVAHVCGMR